MRILSPSPIRTTPPKLSCSAKPDVPIPLTGGKAKHGRKVTSQSRTVSQTWPTRGKTMSEGNRDRSTSVAHLPACSSPSTVLSHFGKKPGRYGLKASAVWKSKLTRAFVIAGPTNGSKAKSLKSVLRFIKPYQVFSKHCSRDALRQLA